jgi:putative ABC transport system permease protein
MGAGFDVEPPSGRGRQFESLLGIYTLAMSVSSLFALFIGIFIIYNSFAIAVTQRRSEIGILRALGATRGQIRTLFLAESAVAGLIGSAAGVAVGLAFTRSLTGATGHLMETMFGVPQNTREILVDPRFLLAAFAVGIITSMIAAFIPARAAARLEPVQALQKGKYQVLGAGENRTRRTAALIAMAASLVCFAFSRYRSAFYAGALLTVLSALLLTPFLALELAKLLRYPLKWLWPIEGSLAADSLIQAPRRTSATVGALMLSLALAIAHGGISLGSVKSIQDWMTGTLNPDLFVNASEVVAAHDFRFPAAMEAELEQIPGVAEVQPVRTSRVKFRGQPIMIVAADVTKVSRRVHRIVIAGDLETMNRLSAEGTGLMVAENLANLQKLRLGEIFELPTPNAPLRLPIVGIIRDYSNQLGAIYIDRKVFVRCFQDDTIDIFRVYLNPGASGEEVRRLIVDRLGGRHRLFVLLNAEVRDYIMKAVNQWLGMTYIQVFVALIVAILGIVNTLTVSISDRRRELGVLRAVGGFRRQIRGTIWLEAGTIGMIGLVLGLVTGAVFLYYELEVLRQDIAGTPLTYEFPYGLAAILLPVILMCGWVSAILPAETAVRGSLVEALEYE